MSAISCEWLDGLLDGDYDFTVYSRKNARAELAALRAAVAERDAMIARERAEEREACAVICDECDRQDERDNGAAMTGAAGNAAAAIRARGEAKE